MSDFTADLKIARIAAEQASAIIKTGFTQQFHTEQKEDESVVTSIDHAAEDVIIKTLREHSQHAILSEEAGALAGQTDLTWIIDPLDGTSNFARHFHPFAVSIALMRGDESLLGVRLPRDQHRGRGCARRGCAAVGSAADAHGRR